ncbi:MAG: hypothetical protein OHK0039_14140 [Bacteroidia bacterium]
MPISRFILLVTAVALLLLLAAWGMQAVLPGSYSLLAMGCAIAIAYVPTLLAYTLSYMGLDKDTSGFVGFLLTGMLSKMLAGLISVLIVALRFRPVRDEYVVVYIIAYFIFTGFEVYGLIRKLRPTFPRAADT